ncbi:MAG: plasmid mobilization relaxosome protein MobC [Alphaproteobacteria bacterium]
MAKSRVVTFRVSEEEKQEMDDFCAKNGYVLSQYISQNLFKAMQLNKTIKQKIVYVNSDKLEFNKGFILQLTKIGTNINQIAYRLNSAKSLNNELFNQVLAELKKANNSLELLVNK